MDLIDRSLRAAHAIDSPHLFPLPPAAGLLPVVEYILDLDLPPAMAEAQRPPLRIRGHLGLAVEKLAHG